MKVASVVVAVWLSLGLSPIPAVGGRAGSSEEGPPPDLVLVTFDTTRRDAVGAFGGPSGLTPNLDTLAEAGVRYGRAVAPSPLTLPSHATLLTGLDPPQHGVRTNGTAVLARGVATLAEVLGRAGYATGAFVGSRVLDHRFGLGRGFTRYGDAMLAERIGEYGYPERPADAVTDDALMWLGGQRPGRPFFLWVHYYDPHAPYLPPDEFRGANQLGDYLGEIAFADREMGRLLEAVRVRSQRVVVAAVGDHGEALGDHGERTHGIFVYTPTIEVPLLIAGPGVPAGRVVDAPVAVRRLPATVLHLLGVGREGVLPGPVLPGLDHEKENPAPIYSEAVMPSAVYGWSPLRAVTAGRWRYIDAPRPELYDLAADPEERNNLVEEKREEAARLQALLDELLSRPGPQSSQGPALDRDTRAALRSLGYLEGGSGGVHDNIDPKDGIGLLADFERAKGLLADGESARAAAILGTLVEQNPSNLPFLNRLAEARLAAGRGDQAVATLGRALELAPGSVFVNLALANTLRKLDRAEEARRAYRVTLDIDRRSAPAWLGLAALGPTPEAERKVLSEALDAGVDSLLVLLRLSRLEAEAGNSERAGQLLDQAGALAPGTAAVPLERVRLLEADGRWDEALETCRRASELEPTNPYTALCAGRVHLARGEPTRARPHLRRAAVLGKGTDAEAEAERLLQMIED